MQRDYRIRGMKVRLEWVKDSGRVTEELGGKSAAQFAYIIQQTFIPVWPDAQRIDGDASSFRIPGKLATAIRVAIGHAIGEQNHAIDSVRDIPAAQLVEALDHTQ